MIMNYDDSNDQEVAVVVCQKFWKHSPGEILQEIFIRLPDFRTALRFATVCRFWHSLICHDPKFVSRFISQHRLHQDRYPPVFPHTIMFRKADVATAQPVIFQIFSKEWAHLYGKSTPSYLDFLPNLPMPIVRAFRNDLLLVSSGPNCTTDDLYVCNPYTKQFIKLPKIARLELPGPRERALVGYALLCMPNIRFKVVEIVPHKLDRCDLLHGRFTVTVFCSESRKWERKSYACKYSRTPRHMLSLDIVVARDEVLYWMGNGCESRTVFYLNLSEGQRSLGHISLPSHDSDYDYQNRIGVVHGLGDPELRVVQIRTVRKQRCKQRCVLLKVWRLLDSKSKWDLVHETRFKWPESMSQYDKLLGPFLHPTNGDLVYIVWGTKVFLFNLVKASYRLIDELPETVHELISIPMFLPYVRSNLQLQGNAQL